MAERCNGIYLITAYYPNAESATQAISYPRRMIDDAAEYPQQSEGRPHALVCELRWDRFAGCLKSYLARKEIKSEPYTNTSVCMLEKKV